MSNKLLLLYLFCNSCFLFSVPFRNKLLFVVKQNQDSPARVSCLAKCEEARKKYRADCNKSPDPVEAAYCVKRGDSTYNFCAGKCPAK